MAQAHTLLSLRPLRHWLIRLGALLGFFAAACLPSLAQERAAFLELLPLREQARVHDEILRERLDLVMPHLMRREGIDLWIVCSRRSSSDPLLRSLLPRAPRTQAVGAGPDDDRVVLVFHDPGPDEPLGRLAFTSRDLTGWYDQALLSEEESVWKAFSLEVQARKPRRIAIGISRDFAWADSLSYQEHEALRTALPVALRERLEPGTNLCRGWFETRIPREIDLYPRLCEHVRDLWLAGLEQGLQPGVSTTTDLAWWYREQAALEGLELLASPTITVQRPGASADKAAGAGDPITLRRGDLLQVGLRVGYLGLAYDYNQQAYVLRVGETAAPSSFEGGAALAKRMQELTGEQFDAARSASELCAAILKQAEAEGLRGRLQTYPLGVAGQATGPWLQAPTDERRPEVMSTWRLQPGTTWAISSSVRAHIPGWIYGDTDFARTEMAWFDGEDLVFFQPLGGELVTVR